jgi:FKBP-type peptidyl-prolyl cis-trans isomerase
MIKTIKLIAFAITISIPFILGSCIGSDDLPDRTSEIEKQELNQALANLEKAGYDVDTTELGVLYVMNKTGQGAFPLAGDTCSLIYTGFFLNGTIFDSSGDYYQDSIWQFKFKEVTLIPGFNDGIALLNKGAEADVIIPSSLAYGANGYGAIPPYTTLVFSLKMRDLKPVLQN